jgi:hypothetical protein
MKIRAEEQDRKTNRNVKPGAKLVDSERHAIEADPLLADLIEFG